MPIMVKISSLHPRSTLPSSIFDKVDGEEIQPFSSPILLKGPLHPMLQDWTLAPL